MRYAHDSTCAATPSPSPRRRCSRRCTAPSVGDDSRDGDPTVRKLEALAGRAHRQGGGAVRAERHDGQPRRAARAYRARRRGAARSELHILSRDGRHRRRRRACSYRAIPAKRGAMDLEHAARRSAPRLTPNKLRHRAGRRWRRRTTAPAARCCRSPTWRRCTHICAARTACRCTPTARALFNAAVALGVGAARNRAPHRLGRASASRKDFRRRSARCSCGSARSSTARAPSAAWSAATCARPGSLAAAGIVALESMVDRLADDHRTAQAPRRGPARASTGARRPGAVETNSCASTSGRASPTSRTT